MRNRWAQFFFGIIAAVPLTLGPIAVAATPAQDRADNGQIRHGEHVVVVVWDGMRPDFISEQKRVIFR